MTSAEIVATSKRLAEYRNVVRYFDMVGMFWLLELAHVTPITIEDARALVESHGIVCRITKRTRRGRAYPPKKGIGYAVTLPEEPGIGFRRLRVGLVLHEIAHVKDHQRRFARAWKARKKITMNHDLGFRLRFAELLKEWNDGRTDRGTVSAGSDGGRVAGGSAVSG